MLRILCIGDIHLGRQSSQLPQEFQEKCSVQTAFRRVIDAAIKLRVDAVVLAGDVVDADNRYFEAYGPLLEGAAQLEKEGIPLLGVAGNHDVEVLPKLASEVAGFHLLGPGGTWSSFDVQAREDPSLELRIWGWSFPTRQVWENPLNSFPKLPGSRQLSSGTATASPPAQTASGGRGELPFIGLLHTQIDGLGTHYAPTEFQRLKASPARAWLLGHVHKPSISNEEPIGYLGSLSPLHPNETGMHGPWLLEFDGASKLRLKQLPLAPLRWEELEVRLDEDSRSEELEQIISSALLSRRRELEPELQAASALGFRLRFVGRSRRVAQLRKSLASFDFEKFRLSDRPFGTFVDSKYRFEVKEAINLEELAKDPSPPGILARRLLRLERGEEDRQLFAQARDRLSALSRRNSFSSLPDEEFERDELRMRLVAQGYRVLEELLEQRALSSREEVAS